MVWQGKRRKQLPPELSDELAMHGSLTASTCSHRWGTESAAVHGHFGHFVQTDHLMTPCWCERHVCYLSPAEVAEGFTKSCGHRECVPR